MIVDYVLYADALLNKSIVARMHFSNIYDNL